MKKDDTDNGRTGIQVISRAARVLRSLKDHPEGLSLGQIATEVNLPRSTIQRIVGALQAERMLIANATGGGVRLGPELGALADAARFNTAEQIRPFLSELTNATGETSDLSVLRGGQMIFIDQVSGTHRLRTVSSVGEVFPLTSTANGRACLAKLPRNEALSYALEEAKHSGTDFDAVAFSNRLDEIERTGVAYDLDEHSEGISAIGFGFADMAGEIHAISVPVPSTRFKRNRKEIEDAVHKTAQRIDAMMGIDAGAA